MIADHPRVVATLQRFAWIVFLMAHGIVHAGIWALPRPAGQERPFDPSQSWLSGSQQSLAAWLALCAAVLLVAAGSFLWAEVPSWRPLAVTGLAVSFLLMSLFFNPWFLPIQVLNAVLIVGLVKLWWPPKATNIRTSRVSFFGV